MTVKKKNWYLATRIWEDTDYPPCRFFALPNTLSHGVPGFHSTSLVLFSPHLPDLQYTPPGSITTHGPKTFKAFSAGPCSPERLQEVSVSPSHKWLRGSRLYVNLTILHLTPRPGPQAPWTTFQRTTPSCTKWLLAPSCTYSNVRTLCSPTRFKILLEYSWFTMLRLISAVDQSDSILYIQCIYIYRERESTVLYIPFLYVCSCCCCCCC